MSAIDWLNQLCTLGCSVVTGRAIYVEAELKKASYESLCAAGTAEQPEKKS
jgi:hypothetical protein